MMQLPELTPVFEAYEALVAGVDSVFAQVSGKYPESVSCKTGCSDCCHALFDLSLVEALYLNRQFLARFPYGGARSSVLEQAADTDRRLTVLKRQYFRSLRDQEPSEQAIHEVLENAARERVRCPLLGQEETCLMYENRPITCRLYGIPTEIGGKGYVCGLAKFEKGMGYPTVHLDKIQNRLDQLSLEIQERLHSRFKELHKVYVPVSMALLTNYDAAYLGIGEAKKES